MGMSGTVILCDHVYQAQGGKYVVAGTFTTIEVHVGDLRKAEHRIEGLSLYLRVRPERLSTLALEVLVRDEARPPWDEPMQRLRMEVPVTERNLRLVECSLVTPAFHLRIDAPPSASATGTLVLRYTIELRVDGEMVASTPLDLRFISAPPAPPPSA